MLGTPLATVDSGLVRTGSFAKNETKRTVARTRKYWNVLGPGLTTGASDDDPSGIATYSQTGAQYGFQLLWLAPLTFPLMAVIQEMCARIGLATGRGLAANIRLHFPRRVLYIATLSLFIANAFNIGADLGAMAKGVQLLNSGLNYTFLILLFTAIMLLMQIYMPYAKYARYLKWLAMVLLAYVASAMLAHISWGVVFHKTLSPSIHWSKDQLLLICAILGTTISPYLFFWQTSQEVEDGIMRGQTSMAARKNEVTLEKVKDMRIDVWSGMLLSNVVMFFIVAACGAILFPKGISHIDSASQAAEALRPFAGNLTYWLFAIGIIGTGLLGIPVLAGASSYAAAESFRWREGLYREFRQAHAFYGVIILSMMIGLSINFLNINPIKALIWSAVLNGLAAPLVLFMIVSISSNRKIMGEWTNRRHTTLIGWLVTALMVVAGLAAIWALF